MLLDFLIFYETKNREFESIVLLRNELVRRGYSVDYISFWETNDITKIKKYKNNVKVAVMPSLYHNTEIKSTVYKLAGKVKNIVNLRWEQAYSNRDENDPTVYQMPKEFAINAIHCNWGVKPKQMLLNAGIPEKNLPITGPMHTDILDGRFNSYFMSREELLRKYNVPNDKKVVLFISSLSSATMTERDFDTLVDVLGQDDASDLISRIELAKNTYNTLLKWFEHYVKVNDCVMIYRPHPTENLSDRILECEKSNRFFIIREENIKQWILVSDIVYTWESTSMAESYFAEKQCGILRPITVPYLDDLGIYEGAKYITTEDEFISSYSKSDERKPYINPKVMRSYYDVRSDKLSCERTADVLEDTLKGNTYFEWSKFGSELFLAGLSNYIYVRVIKLYTLFLSFINVLQDKDVTPPKFISKRATHYKISNPKYLSNNISSKEFAEKEKVLWKLMYPEDINE